MLDVECSKFGYDSPGPQAEAATSFWLDCLPGFTPGEQVPYLIGPTFLSGSSKKGELPTFNVQLLPSLSVWTSSARREASGARGARSRFCVPSRGPRPTKAPASRTHSKRFAKFGRLDQSTSTWIRRAHPQTKPSTCTMPISRYQ